MLIPRNILTYLPEKKMKLKIYGVTFEISYPLAVIMTAVIIYDSSMSVLSCFVSVILHESGHLLMLRYYGCMPDRIRLTLFDIAIVDSSKPLRGTKQELTVTLAGVAVNIIAGTAALIPEIFFGNDILKLFVNANLTLAFFNLLPAHTLDGGHAFMIKKKKKIDIRRAMLIQDILTAAVIIPLGILGFLVLLRSGYNFTLLVTALYLLAVLLMKSPHINTGENK